MVQTAERDLKSIVKLTFNLFPITSPSDSVCHNWLDLPRNTNLPISAI